MKVRDVIVHCRHPWKRISRLAGRALTVFWKLASFEIVSMGDLGDWVSRTKKLTGKGGGGTLLELDLCEMFPNIPRSGIDPALLFAFDACRGNDRGSRRTLWFSILKDGNRKKDGMGKQSPKHFVAF